MSHFLWALKPYYRQVAGQLLLGSLAGMAMNTAVVLFGGEPPIGSVTNADVRFHRFPNLYAIGSAGLMVKPSKRPVGEPLCGQPASGGKGDRRRG
jgi:hypothetical protein